MSGSNNKPAPAVATYRLQMTAEFGFDAAAGIANYLAGLGVSHLYCSPYLQAASGSTHGYDVTDPTRVNQDLGGAEAHGRMTDAIAAAGLGQMLDIVPNHLSTAGGNKAWRDVLRHGKASKFAHFFDIDWRRPGMADKVLLPVLGAPYGQALADGQLQAARTDDGFELNYFDNAFPISPQSLGPLVSQAAVDAGDEVLAFLGDTLSSLGALNMQAGRLYRDERVILALLGRHLGHNPASAKALDARLGALTNNTGDMHETLQRQHYRLAWWRLASSEINYRRFFAINSLAGVRIEDQDVFRYMHDLVLFWVNRGTITGLRVDHIDGLLDPFDYLRKLRAAAGEATWIVVEKILMPQERLTRTWPVQGTTGYDFMNVAGGLYVNGEAEEEFTDFYAEFTGLSQQWDEVLRDNKRRIIDREFQSEAGRLIDMAVRIAAGRIEYRDCPRESIARALLEVIACFGVYRTYARPNYRQIAPSDIDWINQAIAKARANAPDLDERALKFLQGLLVMNIQGEAEVEFLLRFQQLTGPATAKGMEDTSYYCYNRLLSLNEVGGDPAAFGVTPRQFHDWCSYIQQAWPMTMLATSTHDTKRGEDTRLRISMLSEMPQRWFDAVRRWSGMNESRRRGDAPSRNDEYMIYQTLVGAWPIDAQRLKDYIVKACREAKTNTSWNDPDEAYEQAACSFAAGLLDDAAFVKDLEAFLAPLVLPARVSSLSQTLIKCIAPGVPDIYQGSELWNHSLVDPDNRQPVDYDLRRKLVTELELLSPAQTLEKMDAGLPKMAVIHTALALRQRKAGSFGPNAGYEPLQASGSRSGHVVAFVRGGDVIAVAPRLVFMMANDWGDTVLPLPQGRWKNEFTQIAYHQDVALADLLRGFPVALLVREELQ